MQNNGLIIHFTSSFLGFDQMTRSISRYTPKNDNIFVKLNISNGCVYNPNLNVKKISNCKLYLNFECELNRLICRKCITYASGEKTQIKNFFP